MSDPVSRGRGEGINDRKGPVSGVPELEEVYGGGADGEEGDIHIGAHL
jgi:hypothetical protein